MNTNDLTGAALDWAVAQCEGEIIETREASYVGPVHALSRIERDSSLGYVRMKPKLYILKSHLLKIARKATEDGNIKKYNWCGWWYPSNDWEQCGEIIEREGITVGPARFHSGEFFAHTKFGNEWYGPTPLIAAMRCYVASKLGDTVELPEGLKP